MDYQSAMNHRFVDELEVSPSCYNLELFESKVSPSCYNLELFFGALVSGLSANGLTYSDSDIND